MSAQAAPTPVATGEAFVRHRRAVSSDSDDEDTSNVVVPTEKKVVRPAFARAKAPAAAASVGSAATSSAHADPSQPGAFVDSRPSKGASTGLSVDLSQLNYDELAYDNLLELLKKITRREVEEKMALRAQQQNADDQHRSKRVEHFLDQLSATVAPASADHTAAEGAIQGYSYNDMLTHLFNMLNLNNEGSAMTERNQLPVPVLEKIGKKRTVISNFGRICEAFHRTTEEVKDFIEKELSIHGNLDSNNALILKFEIRKATDFDRVLIKYLDEFVKCNSCHRIDTTLTKDVRRMELRCNWCTATRTVTAASTATYSALVEKRSRQRAAMTL